MLNAVFVLLKYFKKLITLSICFYNKENAKYFQCAHINVEESSLKFTNVNMFPSGLNFSFVDSQREHGPFPFVTGRGGYLAHERKIAVILKSNRERHVPSIITG